MTTPNTDLAEQIARALYRNATYYGPEDVQPAWEHRGNEERDKLRRVLTAALTPEPQRPEGAADLADDLRAAGGGEPDDLADALAARGWRKVLTTALTEPQRPEGAEDHEVTIIDTLGAGRLTDTEVTTLADKIAESDS